jgi:hypothetical protein
MSEKKIILNCPMCSITFTTKRRDKIWCSQSCANQFRSIRNNIDFNHDRQKKMSNDKYQYNLEENIFYFKAFINK